ncbi:MAG: fatty acid--CoA ligase [Bacteroidetes bacterium]|nr:fatty acid--CoA ligase [Bacteroidota bacterium]MBS1539587.1 fatty acid--CoA ligase [Bacteroidota bacterium]
MNPLQDTSAASSAFGFPLLIKNILAQSLIYEPEREIVYRDLVRLNYFDLNKRVAQLAQALTTAGVKKGDVIGVIEFDSHRYLEMYFAIPMIGAILHTINFRLSPEQIIYTVNHAEDKMIFCHKAFQPLIEGILPQLTTVEKYVLLSDDKSDKVEAPFTVEYESMIAGKPEHFDFLNFEEDTIATLFYTTGTTGLPKGVYFSHRQLVLHTIAVVAAVGGMDSPARLHSDDVYMPLTPMFHVHAWGIPYVATILGLKQVYPGKYEPEMLLKLVLGEKVTFSHCVPAIMNMLMAGLDQMKIQLNNFKVVIGGSALPSGMAKASLRLGIDIISGYGMSETCPVLSLTYLPKQIREKMSSDEEVAERIKTGRPVFFVEFKLMDDEGNFLPFDGKTVGELVVRAPWLTQSYYKEKERSEELWKYGYMHTGDMAYIQPNQTVVITDRKKDVIKSGGEWISSLDMENLISAFPGVKETAVVGVPDTRWGERPVALVVKAEGIKIAEEDLKNHMQQHIDNGRLSKWAMPDKIIFTEAIPKTSVGKIDKKLIRKQMGETPS